MDNSKKFSDITADQIQDWKARYGADSLTEATIEADGKDHRFILRKPGRSVIDAVSKAGSNAGDANKLLIANCVLGGDMDGLENDAAVYIAVLEQIGALMSKAKATIKKL